MLVHPTQERPRFTIYARDIKFINARGGLWEIFFRDQIIIGGLLVMLWGIEITVRK